MKCELCHQRDAATAITRENPAGGEDELYVCRECAGKERRRGQSQRTRRVEGLPPGVSMSITQVGGELGEGEEPPPIISAIMNAVQGMVGELESKHRASAAQPQPDDWQELPLGRIPAAYRAADRLLLEGLYLLGELDACRRAAEALGLRLAGVEADGVKDAGHAFVIEYRQSEPAALAARFQKELLRQEQNARVRLFEELPRVFGDSVCRALAILKNCRLVSPGEVFDLLSPLRLAAAEGVIEGIDAGDIARLQNACDLTSAEDNEEPEVRDDYDAKRADSMNRRFEAVMMVEADSEGKL